MWAQIWETIAGWFKGLFGGKSGFQAQIGAGNQATTGTTSGDNSPVLTAGRDVNFSMPIGLAAEGDEEVFSDLEGSMPDLLSELREDLAEHSLTRYLVVGPTEAFSPAVNVDSYFKFSKEKYPNIHGYMDILEGYHLVDVRQLGFLYRITEPFAKYLRRK